MTKTETKTDMKQIAFALTCIAIALGLSACTETAPTKTTNSTPAVSASPAATIDSAAATRANYQKNCEGCHGVKGDGGLVKVDNKQNKVPSLFSDHAMKRTDEQLTKKITNGEEDMPAFKDKLSAAEIADLVKFVKVHFQNRP